MGPVAKPIVGDEMSVYWPCNSSGFSEEMTYVCFFVEMLYVTDT